MGRSSSRRRSRRQNAQRLTKERMLAEIERLIDRKKDFIQSKGIDENKLREALTNEFISEAKASRTASRNDSEEGAESDGSAGKSQRGGRRGRRGRRGKGRRRRSSSRSPRQLRSKQKSQSNSRDSEDTDGNQTDDSCDYYPVTKNGLTLEKTLDSLIKKELNSSEPDRDSPDSNTRRLRSSDQPVLTSTAKLQQKLAQLHPKTEPEPSKQDQQTQTPQIGRSKSRSPSLGRRKVRSSPNLTSTVSLLKNDQNKLEESDDMNLMQIIFCFVALGFAMIMFVKLLN